MYKVTIIYSDYDPNDLTLKEKIIESNEDILDPINLSKIKEQVYDFIEEVKSKYINGYHHVNTVKIITETKDEKYEETHSLDFNDSHIDIKLKKLPIEKLVKNLLILKERTQRGLTVNECMNIINLFNRSLVNDDESDYGERLAFIDPNELIRILTSYKITVGYLKEDFGDTYLIINFNDNLVPLKIYINSALAKLINFKELINCKELLKL